jgi:hypothetical protein
VTFRARLGDAGGLSADDVPFSFIEPVPFAGPFVGTVSTISPSALRESRNLFVCPEDLPNTMPFFGAALSLAPGSCR